MAARALASVMLGGGMKLGRKDKTKSKEAKAKAKEAKDKVAKGGKAKEAEQQQQQHDASCPLHVPVARPQGLRGSLTPLLGRRRKKNIVIHRPGVEECTCTHRLAGDQLLRPTPVRPQPPSSGRASSATSFSSETGGTDDNEDDNEEGDSDQEGERRRVGGTMGQRYPPGFDARLRAATPPPAPSGSQIVRSDVATSSDSYEESEESEESESESEESDEESDEYRRGGRRGEWVERSTEEEDEEEDRYYIRTEGNRYLPSRLGKGLEVEEEEREYDDEEDEDEDEDEEGEEEYSDPHEKPTAAIVRHLLGECPFHIPLSTNHKPFGFYLTNGHACRPSSPRRKAGGGVGRHVARVRQRSRGPGRRLPCPRPARAPPYRQLSPRPALF
jgi:hypothetical protein